MKTLLILLKYRLKNTSFSRKTRSRFYIPGLQFLILLLVFGSLIFPGAYRTFSELKQYEESLNLSIVNGLSISESYFSFITLVMLVLGFLNFLPYLVYSLSDYEELNFLLQLPVKKGTIFVYKAFDAFAGTFMSFAIYIPIAFAFGLSRSLFYAFLTLLAAFTGYFLMLTLALFVSSLLFNHISRNIAKRLGGVLILVNAVVFLLLFSVVASNGSFEAGKILEISSSMAKRYLPSYWVAKAATGGGLEWLLLLFFGMWFFRMAYRFASKALFEPVESEKSIIAFNENKRVNLIKKEILLLARTEQSFFFFFYPLIFSIIMIFTTREMYSSTLVMVMISSFYASQMMVISMSSEFLSWPLPAYLPLKLETAILAKTILITMIYTTLFVVSILINVMYLDMNPLLLLSFPGAFMTFFISALLGVKFYLSSGAYKSGVHRRRLGLGSTLILEILTFVAAVGNIMVLMAFLYVRGMQKVNTLLFDLLFSGTTGILLGLGIPIFASVVMTVYSMKALKKQLRLIKEGK